jgi:hypothetical protein
MATTFTQTHTHGNRHEVVLPAQRVTRKRTAKRSVVVKFISDLFEDLGQKPLQDAKFAKHDMFREHINAMSISYFSLILLLIAGSVFLLPALIPLLTQ